jgi:diketogulonate reductase-like aldo/keto reductase
VIDSYVLHGPTERSGVDPPIGRLGTVQESGRARAPGVSNVTLEQLDGLCQQARVERRFVQSRCYAAQGRELCATKRLVD